MKDVLQPQVIRPILLIQFYAIPQTKGLLLEKMAFSGAHAKENQRKISRQKPAWQMSDSNAAV